MASQTQTQSQTLSQPTVEELEGNYSSQWSQRNQTGISPMLDNLKIKPGKTGSQKFSSPKPTDKKKPPSSEKLIDKDKKEMKISVVMSQNTTSQKTETEVLPVVDGMVDLKVLGRVLFKTEDQFNAFMKKCKDNKDVLKYDTAYILADNVAGLDIETKIENDEKERDEEKQKDIDELLNEALNDPDDRDKVGEFLENCLQMMVKREDIAGMTEKGYNATNEEIIELEESIKNSNEEGMVKFIKNAFVRDMNIKLSAINNSYLLGRGAEYLKRIVGKRNRSSDIPENKKELWPKYCMRVFGRGSRTIDGHITLFNFVSHYKNFLSVPIYPNALNIKRQKEIEKYFKQNPVIQSKFQFTEKTIL